MNIKSACILASLACTAMATIAAPALAYTVETTGFISSPTNFNGFEYSGNISFSNGQYTEGGITVQHNPTIQTPGYLYPISSLSYFNNFGTFLNGQGSNFWYGWGFAGY